MSKVLVILGTRPEAIKLAPVIRELARSPNLEPVVCVTSQHRQMQDQILDLFEIKPDFDLDVMENDQNLFDLTGRILSRLRPVLEQTNASAVMVQGDTTTAMTGALAAYYAQTPIVHVEAGLRTGNKYSPFPEEANRAFVDVIADFCFAPTETAAQHLRRAGVDASRIFVTGNTAIDALFGMVERLSDTGSGSPTPGLLAELPTALRDRSEQADVRLVLVTSHRRESFGTDLESICHALCDIVKRNRDVEVVYPVHLNPRVRDAAYAILRNTDRVHLLEPVGYAAFIWLMMHCYLVVTDSGGIQEEAPSLGKPVVVVRKNTERPEGIEAGTSVLAGVDREGIVEAVESLLNDAGAYRAMAAARNPYGDGHAAEHIAEILSRRLA